MFDYSFSDREEPTYSENASDMGRKKREFINKMKNQFPDDDYFFEDGRFVSTFQQMMWEWYLECNE